MAQTVKRLPAMQETRVQSLGRENPLEKEMATYSSTLAWRNPWSCYLPGTSCLLNSCAALEGGVLTNAISQLDSALGI